MYGLKVQSWTALFRAFSSHRQPSAIFSKVFPAEQTSWPNWQTLLACTEADALVGHKRFFLTCGTLETSEKVAGSLK